MTLKTILVQGVTLAAICSLSAPAFAQPVTPPLPGAAITGVCYFSFQRLVAGTNAGRNVNTRLQQIASQVQAELSAEGNALNNDIRTFETQRTTLTPQVQQQRADALQTRAQAFQRKQQQRQREMELTQQQAIGRLSEQVRPLMIQTASTRVCSVLLDDNIVIAANQTMDITPAVITATDAAVQPFNFDRVQVNPQTGQPITPGAAAPAVPAPATPAPATTRPRR